MVHVFYIITTGLHLIAFPAKLQVIRENKSKKAIMSTLFKCFDVHSCICFHVCMLSVASSLKALVWSILTAQPVVLQGQWYFKDKGRPCLKKCQRYTPYRTLNCPPYHVVIDTKFLSPPGRRTPTWATGPVPNKERHLPCPTPTL